MIYFHFILYHVVVAEAEEGCEQKGKKYKSKTLKHGKIKHVEDWEACASKCAEKPLCFVWSWKDRGSARRSYCKLKKMGTRTKDDDKYTSGTKSCQGIFICCLNILFGCCF